MCSDIPPSGRWSGHCRAKFGDDLPPPDTKKPIDLPRLVALAKSADLVRGYGHIKEANVVRYRAECTRLESGHRAAGRAGRE